MIAISIIMQEENILLTGKETFNERNQFLWKTFYIY